MMTGGVLFDKVKTELIQAPGGISGSYTIPDSTQSIGEWAFCDSDNLNVVTIGNSVQIIGYGAFQDCDRLTTVTIPGSVQTIDSGAFQSCDRLADVYYEGTQAQWNTVEIGRSNGSLQEATIHFHIEIPDIPAEPGAPGNLDGNNFINEDDAIYLLQAILMPEMFPVKSYVDFDKNGTVNEDDAIFLLQHVLMPEMFPL